MRAFLGGSTALALLFTGVMASGADEATDLRWRFRKGENLKYELKHREVRTVEIGDQKRTASTDMDWGLHWIVREVDDQGVATLGVKVTALRVRSEAMDFEFQYDSASGNSSDDDYKKQLIRFYDQIRFAEYELKLPPAGRPVRVSGFDQLLTETAPEQNVVAFYGVNLRDATFAWFLQQVLGPLPGAAAKPGRKWEVPVDAKLPEFGQLSGRSLGSLGESKMVGGVPCQEIRVKGEQTLDTDMKWLNAPLRGSLKTTKMEAKLLLDPKKGRILTGEASIHLQGDLKFGAGDDAGLMKVRYEHTLELAAR